MRTMFSSEYLEYKKLMTQRKYQLVELILRDVYTENIQIENDLDDELLWRKLMGWNKVHLITYYLRNRFK